MQEIYCKDKAEVCNLSIFKPENPDLCTSTFDKHPLNISCYFGVPHFLSA